MLFRHFVCLLCHPRACPGDPGQPYGFFFIWILGSSPRMTDTSKHLVILKPRHSIAVSGAQCFQLAARLPCRWILGSSPRMTNNSKHFVILNSAGASRISRHRTNRSLRPSPAKQKNYHQRSLYHNKAPVSSSIEKHAGDFGKKKPCTEKCRGVLNVRFLR